MLPSYAILLSRVVVVGKTSLPPPPQPPLASWLSVADAPFGWTDGWEAMKGGEKADDCLEKKSAQLWTRSLVPVSRSRGCFGFCVPARASRSLPLWITHPVLSLHLTIVVVVVVGASGRLRSAPRFD